MMIPVHFSCVIKLQGAQKILIGYEINHSCGFNLLATSGEIDGETVETVSDFIFGGSKITADGDCSHERNGRWEGPLGTPLGLVHWKRASSPVEAGTAGYL